MQQSRLFVLGVFCLTANTAFAGQISPAAHENNDTVQVMSAIHTEIVTSDQLAGQFESLAGSHENAQNLVVGLRNAKPVKIVAVASASAQPDISFTPPTRPMSFSDVHQALLLAQAHLQSKNITSPTPAQIKAALAGGELPNAHGDITRVIGILPLHQRGMSWVAIARVLHISVPKKVAVSEQTSANPPTPVAQRM